MRLRDRLLLNACTLSYRFSRRVRFTVSLPCGSSEVRVPIIHGCGWPLLSFRDNQIQHIVSKLYDEGRRGCFVDIGANQRKMILNVLALDLHLPYYGFEPDLTGAHYIQELIRANKLKNHHVFPVALGAHNSTLTLHKSHAADVNSTLGLDLRPPQMYSETALVPVCTADNQLKKLNDSIFLVKIDTEGWEIGVLLGVEGILSEKRLPVYFEVMGYRHFLEGTYPREYCDGELDKCELMRLVDNRRANMANLDSFWRRHAYALHMCHEDGTLHEVQSLDPGPENDENLGEMNFLALG